MTLEFRPCPPIRWILIVIITLLSVFRKWEIDFPYFSLFLTPPKRLTEKKGAEWSISCWYFSRHWESHTYIDDGRIELWIFTTPDKHVPLEPTQPLLWLWIPRFCLSRSRPIPMCRVFMFMILNLGQSVKHKQKSGRTEVTELGCVRNSTTRPLRPAKNRKQTKKWRIVKTWHEI